MVLCPYGYFYQAVKKKKVLMPTTLWIKFTNTVLREEGRDKRLHAQEVCRQGKAGGTGSRLGWEEGATTERPQVSFLPWCWK